MSISKDKLSISDVDNITNNILSKYCDGLDISEVLLIIDMIMYKIIHSTPYIEDRKNIIKLLESGIKVCKDGYDKK